MPNQQGLKNYPILTYYTSKSVLRFKSYGCGDDAGWVVIILVGVVLVLVLVMYSSWWCRSSRHGGSIGEVVIMVVEVMV